MGKQKVQNKRALSALTHGATAGILPDEQRTWPQHLRAVRATLQPVDPVEEALVEGVALALWRLRRVAAWEAALVTEARDRAREPRELAASLVPGSPPGRQQAAALDRLRWPVKDWLPPLADSDTILAEARDRLEVRRAEVAALERARMTALTDRSQLDPVDAATIGWFLLEALDEEERGQLAARGVVLDAEPRDLVPLVELLGAELVQDVQERAYHDAHCELMLLEVAIQAYEQATAEQQARARPDLDELAKLQRYEAHLERVLYRALHELGARQARRQGEAVPLGRLEVCGVNDLRALED